MQLSAQVMQRWIRHSQCLFCELRASLRPSKSTVERPAAFSSAAQYADRRHSQPSLRHDRHQNTKKRKLNLKPILENPSSRVKHVGKFPRHDDIKEDRAKRRNDILRAMKRVHAFYTTSKMNQSSNISQMDALDPERTLWPQFEADIKGALAGPGGRKSGLVNDLMNVKTSEHLIADAQRTIQFAFLDYVLDHGDILKAGGTGEIDLRYPTEWYPQARTTQRVIHLHVGPTNSGKTYNALKRLENASSGFYAGPLRLLAHEVYSRFNKRGIKCELVTGDDVRLDDSGEVQLYASTVEMVDSKRFSEVGVVDEIQMMGDIERGWAWTRALLSAQVKELHLCGETRVVPLIREIVASMGDTLHIHQYERLNPLKVMSRSLKGNLQNLRKGDCVVSFSIVNIHALKRQIELDTGRHCAIIYGSLPPETRAQQAALFNDPNNDYDFLVASDAIGMGLNLSIKRIVFETLSKWNGTFREQLSIPQIKQIAGRAGRYRTAQDDQRTEANTNAALSTQTSKEHTKPKTIGLVTCIDEVDLPILQRALSQDGPPLRAAGIFPPGEFYEELAARLPENTPFEYILRRMQKSVATSDRFRMCDIRDQLETARAIGEVPDLTIAARLTICAAPVSFSNSASRATMVRATRALAKIIAINRPVTVADIAEIPLEVLDEPMTADRQYLVSLENLHKCLILYLWLSYRFSRALEDQDMAIRAKELCEEKINTTLMKFSANPRLRERLLEIQKSSEMLREQAKANGWEPSETPLIMNPDHTVAEIDSMDIRENTEQSHVDGEMLEEGVQFEGELDLGTDDALVSDDGDNTDTQVRDAADAEQDNHNEPEKAKVSG